LTAAVTSYVPVPSGAIANDHQSPSTLNVVIFSCPAPGNPGGTKASPVGRYMAAEENFTTLSVAVPSAFTSPISQVTRE
jgi:hypothetical protein